MKLEKSCRNFFHDYLNGLDAVRFNLVPSCPYMHFFGLVVFLLCYVLHYCDVLFYFY